jgi:putative endopeptidase
MASTTRDAFTMPMATCITGGKFTEKALRLVKQFDQYTVNDSLHINGRASLGENIADLGGVVMGYEAFKESDQYKKGGKIAGLTPDERYFLGYAYAWMVQTTPKSIAHQIMSDVHSPPKYRVIGPLSDMDQFYKTFNISPGGPYYIAEKDRVNIW